MEIVYGQGKYLDGASDFEGDIVLSEYKLFLRGAAGDWAQTFIPLEKIKKVRLVGDSMEISVCLSQVSRYTVKIKGENKNIKALAKELAVRRGFKKSFVWNVWVETEQ